MLFRAGDKNEDLDAQDDAADPTTTAPGPEGLVPEEAEEALEAAAESKKSKRGIFLILAGIVMAGAAATYKWWKGLAK